MKNCWRVCCLRYETKKLWESNVQYGDCVVYLKLVRRVDLKLYHHTHLKKKANYVRYWMCEPDCDNHFTK